MGLMIRPKATTIQLETILSFEDHFLDTMAAILPSVDPLGYLLRKSTQQSYFLEVI